MARFNKIFMGPTYEDLPQVIEAPVAGGALLPGTIVVLSAGTLIAHNAANGRLQHGILQDNYEGGGQVDDTIAIGEIGKMLVPLENQLFGARLATGVSVVRGSRLVSNGAGLLVLVTAGVRECLFYADEVYNNTSGVSQIIRVRPSKETTA